MSFLAVGFIAVLGGYCAKPRHCELLSGLCSSECGEVCEQLFKVVSQWSTIARAPDVAAISL